MTLTLSIDACPPRVGRSGDHVRDLFPADGEFVGAVCGMRHRTSVFCSVPDAVFLELYAYEVLERAREFAPVPGDQTWRIPFSVEALFAAADVRAHAGREIERMLPAFDQVFVSIPQAATLATEANRVLGAVRFDPERYVAELTAIAASRGWEIGS